MVAYGPHLNLPFIGDDYVFLDKTRSASFFGLWSFRNVDFQWYRPWSREFYFWLLQRLAGVDAKMFRIFGVALWLVSLALYAAIVRRLASSRTAVLATLGVASLALWGTPLLWVSGSQDLWMLAFTMTSLLLFILGHRKWALAPFALALLSKETSAVFPLLLVGYLVVIERKTWRHALCSCAAFWALVLGWLLVHPTLHARLLSHVSRTPETEHRPTAVVILVRTLLSSANLDMVPRPQEVDGLVVLRALVCAGFLAAGMWFLASSPQDRHPTERRQRTRDVAIFGIFWMAIGWLPLFFPSIAWHAYYGCLGVLGAWLVISLGLERRPGVAVIAVVALALLRAAEANTLTWDWGNESYLRRAGNILSAIRGDLRRQHPSFPHHSRVYFAHIPNNIGLVAGKSPALRVWYADSTLEAGFYSYYRPRRTPVTGSDLFFRFDSTAGMVEVKAGREDVRLGLLSDPAWEQDHQDLAMVFLRSGDTARAALEFEKLSQLPNRPDAAGFAGVCWESVGDSTRADSLYADAGLRMGFSPERLGSWISRLRRSFPVGAYLH